MKETTKAQLFIVISISTMFLGIWIGNLYFENIQLKEDIFDIEYDLRYQTFVSKYYEQKVIQVTNKMNLTMFRQLRYYTSDEIVWEWKEFAGFDVQYKKELEVYDTQPIRQFRKQIDGLWCYETNNTHQWVYNGTHWNVESIHFIKPSEDEN